MESNIKITYIYHSCFLVEFERYGLLFDLPGDEHLPKKGLDVLTLSLSNMDKKTLYVFFSHSHGDHFNPNIEKIIKPFVPSYKLVISYDIYSNYNFESKNVYVLGPDEKCYIDNIKVFSYESNDMGNGYLIFIDGIKLYYGGDLAEWIWPDTREEERKFIVSYFEEILKELKEYNIHIGFSNFDPRIKNFGGGIKFIETVKPKYFIPMHTFGRYTHLNKLKEISKRLNINTFLYSEIGAKFEINIDES